MLLKPDFINSDYLMHKQFLLYGKVIHGDGIGRKIGYPTANLDPKYFRINMQLPGVHAARAWVQGKRYDAVAIIGMPWRGKGRKIEVHLLDVDLNLYGQTVTAELLGRIRPLRSYVSMPALLRRIRLDIRLARKMIERADVQQVKKIASIRTAVKKLETGLRQVKQILQIGRSEIEVRNRSLKIFAPLQPSFPFIIAFGFSAAAMHHVPTRRKLKSGDMIVVDLGVIVNGYCSDLTRTFILGQPSPLLRKRYQAVLRAHGRGVRAVRPFIFGKAVDDIVRGSLRRDSLHSAFIHSTGHGVGKKIHQPPSLSPKSLDMLLPGDVVTIEPGVYFQDWGGIRIEDMVLVTDHGAELLTGRIPRQLHEMIL